MTIARDIKTGAVVGQLTNKIAPNGWVVILTRDGKYRYEDPRSTVRLEKVS